MVLFFNLLPAALTLGVAIVLLREIRKMAATQTDLSNAIANLDAALAAAAVRVTATAPPADFQPDVDAVNRMITVAEGIDPVVPVA